MILRRNTSPGAPGCDAAPAGGARLGCRGCLSFCFALLVSSAPIAAQVDLPSGQKVEMFDHIADEGLPGTYRVRYLAPEIGQDGRGYVEVADDMAVLCETRALPKLVAEGNAPERIVVTLMSAPVEFGVMTPDVTQFFESYSIENGLCIWEAF